MERPQQNNKPWALLFILIGIVLLVMAWTSYDFVLRVLVTISAIVSLDYGMGMLGLPTPSQLLGSLFGHFFHKK